MSRPIHLGGVSIGAGDLVFIGGPCVIEDEALVHEVARGLAAITRAAGVGFVLKASFDKANRTSGGSFRGLGLTEGLRILGEVRRAHGVPVTTDVHTEAQAERAAEVVDLLQVPAFLCRQTDLLVACARSGRPVNVKKGQFLAPDDVGYVIDKLDAAGAAGVAITERGTTFGHHDLVVDFRGLVTMRSFGVPIVFDATHSVQRPGGAGGRSGGDRAFAAALGRAAVAVGVDAVFAEVHPRPPEARSDADTQLPLGEVGRTLAAWARLFRGRAADDDG